MSFESFASNFTDLSFDSLTSGDNCDVVTFHQIGAMFIGLGELGRSTRLVNIAIAMAQQNPTKGFILAGYYDEYALNETLPPNVIISRITRHDVTILPGPLHLFLKTFYLALNLLRLLYQFPGSGTALFVQNPPSIPVLIAVMLLRWCGKFVRLEVDVIMDWHNIGGTIESIQKAPLLTKWTYTWLERYLGSTVPTSHLTVSCALANYLQNEFGISRSAITVLHDQPSKSITLELARPNHSDNIAFRKQLTNPQLIDTMNSINGSDWMHHHSIPGLQCHLAGTDMTEAVICTMGSSFTEDEGTQELVMAMNTIDRKLETPVIVIVTGAGVLKDAFKELIRSLSWRNVSWYTGYTSSEDLWRILRVADIGLCLFYSSSGLDIPMKAFDLVGAKVPNNIYWDYGLPMIEFLARVTNEETNYIQHKHEVHAESYLWCPVGSQSQLEEAILSLANAITGPRVLASDIALHGHRLSYDDNLEPFSTKVEREYKHLVNRRLHLHNEQSVGDKKNQ